MVRKANNPPSMAKMYRHFAVITVLLTVAVAIMADSGNSRHVDDAVETVETFSAQKRQQHSKTNKRAFGTGQLVDASRSGIVEGEFAPDSWVGTAGSGASSYRPPARRASTEEPRILLGLTREEFEALSPEEQAEMLETLQDRAMDDATMARISRQSMRRAGRTEPSQDAPD